MTIEDRSQEAGIRIPYLPGLDGLRGVAVLAVLLFHAGHLRGGWLGVDVFFVLSGFLITSLLIAEHHRDGRISMPAFWGRRAKRLLPALFAVLLAVAVHARVAAPVDELARLRDQAFATLLYVANWEAISAASDYWSEYAAPTPLHHAWSLAIEEQFYLVWPLLVVAVLSLAKWSPRALGAVAVALSAVAVVWSAWLFDVDQGTARVYYGSDTRAPALLLGAALAVGLRRWLKRGANAGQAGDAQDGDTAAGALGRVAAPLGVVAVVALVAASLTLSGREPELYRGGLALLGCASAAVILAVVLAPAGVVARFLATGPLRALGIVSYGVYLWHWPLYVILTEERVGLAGWALTGVRVAATVVVAAASYFLLEKPIRHARLGARLGVPAVVIVAAAIALATFEATKPVQSDLAAESHVVGPMSGSAQGAADRSARNGGIGASGESYDVLFVGDSVAEAMGTALEAEGKRRGLRTKVWSAPACGLIAADASRTQSGAVKPLPQCEAVRAGWMQAAHMYRPSVEVVLEGWIGIGDRKVDGAWVAPCHQSYDERYEEALRAWVVVAPAETQVVVTLAPPGSVADLVDGAMGKVAGMGPEKIAALTTARMKCMNDRRREVIASTRAQELDLESAICPSGECARDHDGVRLRRDGIHFRDDGARIVAAWIFDELEDRYFRRR